MVSEGPRGSRGPFVLQMSSHGLAMKIDVLRLALAGATVALLLSAAACSPKPEEKADASSAAAEHTPGDMPPADTDATARQDAEAAVAAAMAASPTASDTPVATAPASPEAASAH